MAAFVYELTAKLGGAYASKTVKITLEDANGNVVNFEDATAFKAHNGTTCKIREKGTKGTYHIWIDQWPQSGLPFTVLIKDNADDSFIDSIDFNLDDFSRRAIADFDPATQADILSDATPFAGADIAAIVGYIDTEIAAILAAVDTEIAAIKAKVDNLAFTSGNVHAHLKAKDSTLGLSTQEKADTQAECEDAIDAKGATITVVSPSAVVDDKWTFFTHETVTQVVTGLGDMTGYLDVWVALKKNRTDLDSKAILLFSTSVGLEVLNKSSTVTATDASVTVDNDVAGDITMTLKAALGSELAPSDEDLVWGIKWKDANGVHTLLDGWSEIKAGPVKAIS